MKSRITVFLGIFFSAVLSIPSSVFSESEKGAQLPSHYIQDSEKEQVKKERKRDKVTPSQNNGSANIIENKQVIRAPKDEIDIDQNNGVK